jgi:predicted choloylglycine hydrolase
VGGSDAPASLSVRAFAEDAPGPRWGAWARSLWPAWGAWFLREGAAARPSYLAGERALRRHMPALLPVYEALCGELGGGDLPARFLASWCPPAFATGCTQAVWGGSPPVLVRNYDYAPALWEAAIWRTGWGGRRVLGLSDGLWGLLDGVNEEGLALSLSFGGRRVVGPGFGVTLLVRYALQVCETTPEAVATLSRLPCHMAYTVSALDAAGRHATLFLSPDRPPVVGAQRAAANHQRAVEWEAHARSTGSPERQARAEALAAGAPDAEALAEAFLEPPLRATRYAQAAGTLYTAVYRPRPAALTLRWPGQRWELPMEGFVEEERRIALGGALPGRVP